MIVNLVHLVVFGITMETLCIWLQEFFPKGLTDLS